MDFLDPKKQKAHRIRLFIGYGLMAILLGITTMQLFLRSGGIVIDPLTGEVVQNGLVFIDAHPEAATIWLNGENKGQTDQRMDIAAGDYELELSRDGYRTWKRSFTLEGSSIERFVYPFLFPETLKTTDSQLYGQAPAFTAQSPDRRWLVVQQPGSITSFDLVDLSSATATTTTLALPAGLLEPSGANHKLELIEWSTNNRHVALKHIHDSGSEFFVLDIESAGSSVNLSKSFSAPFTELRLRDKKFDQYYLYNAANRTLHTAELTTGQTNEILQNVLTFKPHGSDVMIYVSTAAASEDKVLVHIREGENDYVVRELSVGNKYLIDVARFDNAWYFSVGSDAEQKTYVYRNPVAAIKRRPDLKPVPVGVLRLSTAPEFVSFSTNARFVAIQGGGQFSVYDAETDRQYRYDANLGLASNQEVIWMDGHRLSVVANDKTVVFDFDGTNKQELSAGIAGSLPIFHQDYEALYNIAPSVTVPGRFALTRTELRVTQ